MQTKRSLFWQLYLSLLILMIASLTTLAIYLIGSAKSLHRQKFNEHNFLFLTLLGDELLSLNPLGPSQISKEKLESLLNQWAYRLSPFAMISIHDKSGVLIEETRLQKQGNSALDDEEELASSPELWEEILIAQNRGEAQVIRSLRRAQFKDLGLFFISVKEVSLKEGSFFARVAVPLSRVDAMANGLYSDYFLVFMMTLLASALVCWWISKKLSRPLEMMTFQANKMAAGDFSMRINRSQITTKEIYNLTLAMNKMSKQLRRRLKTIIEEKNEKETILSNMTEGVLAVTNHLRVISMNYRASQILGCDFSGNYLRKSLIEVVRIPELEDFFLRANKTEQNLEEKKQILLKTGPREVFFKSNPYMIDQKRAGTVVVISDVTQLQKLEAIRKDFVANVSHELKTPLTSIHGYAETLLENPRLDEITRTRFLQKIEKHSSGLTHVISDLLELSRLENIRGGERDFEDFQMKDVIVNVRESLADLAFQKGVQLVFKEFTSICPGQKGLITQAVLNLVKNAIRYTPEGGEVQVSEEIKEAFVTIHVQDNGVGIDKPHLHRLFERFYRVDESRNKVDKGRDPGGTGLGLALVKHIALIHHGDISVKSKPNQGSTFSLKLPLAKQTKA